MRASAGFGASFTAYPQVRTAAYQLPSADLAQLTHGPEPPQRERRVGAAGDDEVRVLGEVLQEEGHRLAGYFFGHELVVVEDQQDPMGQLGDLVYERGKRCSDEPRPHGAHPREYVGAEILYFRHDPAQRLHYAPPQPDRIVVLI